MGVFEYTHSQFGWLVFGLLCLITILVAIRAAIHLAYGKAATEPFVGGNAGDDRYWLREGRDRAARRGTQCSVLDTRKTEAADGHEVIEIVHETCEDGLPHTVDANRIRMTEAVWNSERREEILRHERIHLLQRRDPLVWKRFYEEKWGYTHVTNTIDDAQIPAVVRDTVRSNPDTADAPWTCWQNRYWFLPVFTDPKNPKIRQTETRVWDARTQSWTSPPPEWTAFFCEDGRCPHQWEHPHEISAEMASDPTPWKTPAALYLSEFLNSLQHAHA